MPVFLLVFPTTFHYPAIPTSEAEGSSVSPVAGSGPLLALSLARGQVEELMS